MRKIANREMSRPGLQVSLLDGLHSLHVDVQDANLTSIQHIHNSSLVMVMVMVMMMVMVMVMVMVMPYILNQSYN